MVRVDKTKCNRCYACIAQCSYNFILQKDDKGFPKSRIDFSDHCIDCFHCVAICRERALFHSKSPSEDCLPIHETLFIQPEHACQFLKSRRSLRTFVNRPIPRETIAELIDVTRWSPTARNLQPVEWLVIESPERVQKMAELVINWLKEEGIEHNVTSAWDKGLDMVLRGAPHLVVAHSNVNRFWGAAESATALSYLELAAHAHNIGSCWAGYFTKAATVYTPLRDLLGIPETNEVFGAVMLGYTKYSFSRIPNRKKLEVKWM